MDVFNDRHLPGTSNNFTLNSGDEIIIRIDGIGELQNLVE
jgi:hypothetical protein